MIMIVLIMAIAYAVLVIAAVSARRRNMKDKDRKLTVGNWNRRRTMLDRQMDFIRDLMGQQRETPAEDDTDAARKIITDAMGQVREAAREGSDSEVTIHIEFGSR